MKKYRIVISPDSFKGSISSFEAAKAIERGLNANSSVSVETVCLPIADGGEGTLDALVPPEKSVNVRVLNPLGNEINARYGIIGDTAIIEIASCAGLTLISPEERSAGLTTTYGVGQIILDALDRGIRKILLTVGGSATNDGGAGLLASLGALFSRGDGSSFVPTGLTLKDISRIDVSGLDSRIFGCCFSVATDVTNPLLGEKGATYVYGKQKGATADELEITERGMAHYAALLEKTFGKDVSEIPGCGAGGGVSAPLLAMGNTTVERGIELVLKTVCFDRMIEGCDYVITGEGKFDCQSLFGKTVSGVLSHAEKKGVPVVCFVGCLNLDGVEILPPDLTEILSVREKASSDGDSMSNAEKYLTEIAREWSERVLKP